MPTASAVRITALILCGSNTFSNTTVRSGWRLFNTEVSRSFLSGVMRKFKYLCTTNFLGGNMPNSY